MVGHIAWDKCMSKSLEIFLCLRCGTELPMPMPWPCFPGRSLVVGGTNTVVLWSSVALVVVAGLGCVLCLLSTGSGSLVYWWASFCSSMVLVFGFKM